MSAEAETSSLPAPGVPDATALFPLTALTSAGGAVVSSGGQRSFGGVVNNTARSQRLVLGDLGADSERNILIWLCRWVADDVFGFVLDCAADQENSIILDPIPIGTQLVVSCPAQADRRLLTHTASSTTHCALANSGKEGPFAVNLWFRANVSANTGNAYSYLLSAIAYTTPNVSAGNNTYIPNSLQLMLPQVWLDETALSVCM